MDIAAWESDPPKTKVILESQHFSARGMRPVYGRGDHFGRGHTFNMDIWKNKDGQLFMRFWSYCSEIDGREFEIKGLDAKSILLREKGQGFKCSWIPRGVREAYDEWIREEF